MMEVKKLENSGQVALVILAIMAVTLTMGLSLSQRVLTDVQVSQREQESAEAFSAAESGAEEALRNLKIGETVTQSDVDQLKSQLAIDELTVESVKRSEGTVFSYPGIISPGETAIIWLAAHNDDGTINESDHYAGETIDVCWQDEAAMEVVYFFKSGASYHTARYVFDNNAGRRTGAIADPSLTSCGELNAGETINTGEIPLFLVLRPFYSLTRVAAVAGSNLPSQGYDITSTASVTRDTATKISRRVNVFAGWSGLASYFFNVLTTGQNIVAGQ